MNSIKASVLVIVLAILLTSCSISKKGTIAITKPIRSIEDMTSGKKSILNEADIPKTIAITQLINKTDDTDSEEVSAILRAILQSHLSNKNFQLVHTKEVDLKNPNNNLSPQQLAHSLGVDGIITGEVVEYERFYAGIYAHIKLGVDLKLLSKDGEILWKKKQVITSRAGGASTTAWGLLFNAALAALHLEDKNLFAAADELGRAIARDIPEPSGYIGSSLPSVEMVIHDGANKWLKYGDTLMVGIKGQSGLRALVDLEGIGTFDLEEKAQGFYQANITVDKRWNGSHKIISGKLIDNKGQIGHMLSTTGLVNFDNQAPTNVTDLKVDFATTNEIKLSWKNANEKQISYSVQLISKRKGLTPIFKQTKENNISLFGEYKNFEQLEFGVTANDRANNKSVITNITVKVYPIKLAYPNELDSHVSGNFSGVSVFSKKNSPYIINRDTLFTEDSTLLIEPGVNVKFKQSSSITIKGQAYFFGGNKKSDQNIIFNNQSLLSPAKKYLILNGNQTIEINGLSLINAGIGIEVNSGSPNINYLFSDGSKYSALSINNNAITKLNNCHLSGSTTSAIVLSGRSRLTLNNCSFNNNKPFHIQNSSSFPVIMKQVMFDKSAVIPILGASETN